MKRKSTDVQTTLPEPKRNKHELVSPDPTGLTARTSNAPPAPQRPNILRTILDTKAIEAAPVGDRFDFKGLPEELKAKVIHFDRLNDAAHLKDLAAVSRSTRSSSDFEMRRFSKELVDACATVSTPEEAADVLQDIPHLDPDKRCIALSNLCDAVCKTGSSPAQMEAIGSLFRQLSRTMSDGARVEPSNVANAVRAVDALVAKQLGPRTYFTAASIRHQHAAAEQIGQCGTLLGMAEHRAPAATVFGSAPAWPTLENQRAAEYQSNGPIARPFEPR